MNPPRTRWYLCGIRTIAPGTCGVRATTPSAEGPTPPRSLAQQLRAREEAATGLQTVAFIVRSENVPPPGVIFARELLGTGDEAAAFARAILAAHVRQEDLAAAFPATSSDDEEKVSNGSVAQYTDGRGHVHVAIVLRILEQQREADALFLTSSDRWTKARRATRDELALCGFVGNKITYLGLVRRDLPQFEPTGVSFPEHRVAALLKEFLP